MHENTSRQAVLLVDFQRAFCCADGSVAAQGRDVSTCRAAADRAIELAAAARAASIPVIWTRLVFRDDYADGGRLIRVLRPGLARIGALKIGTPDAEIVPEADVQPGDFIIEKQRYSSFYATGLEAVLRSLDIDSLIVCGVTTSMCVETTVRDAAQRDYRTFVVREACGDFDAERHEASLSAMGFGFADIIGFEQALEACSNGRLEFADR